MALWSWITGRLNVRDYQPWSTLYGRDNDTGESVTLETAYRLSTWWACTRLTAETGATLPIGVFSKDSNGDPVPEHGHFLYSLLRNEPNEWQTPVEFWEGRIAPLCTEGNSYAEKRLVGDRLVALHPLKPDTAEPFLDEKDGYRLKYRVNDRGKTQTMPADKIFHIRGFGPDEIKGLSPLSAAAQTIGTARAAERATARLYGKGLRAAGFFKPPDGITPEQKKQFEKNYIKPMEGVQAEGKAMVMPPGFEWTAFGITPRDAELIASRSLSIEDLCRYMMVPPILVGHHAEGQTMWGSGVEHIILAWLTLSLRAYLKRIEAAVNYRLMPREDRAKGIYFEFNIEGLLRADSAARASFMSTMAQNGLATRNELRKYDNRASKPGGDQLTVQSNLVPLDQLGVQQQKQAEVVRNAFRTWLMADRDAA